MADASNITVAVETAVHSIIAEMVAKIYRDHKIRIDGIDVAWQDFSTAHSTVMLPVALHISSTTDTRELP